MAGGITDLAAVALSAAIRARRVSCVEVMDACLDQIGRLNPLVNAIVSLQDPERLHAQAAERDEELARGEWRGVLHGFPQAPKDLAATAGIPTSHGSPILKDHVPPADDIVVERARRAGAILIGKTNTPEFGLGSQTYNPVHGTTRNTYDQRLAAGGSSGGAAVALALRMLQVADGSDMMGSLRNPAGWNNVVGFRPSSGRIPNASCDAFLPALACEGPMGRTVADTALRLSVQAGFDARDPLSIREDPALFADALSRDFKGSRIAWMGDLGGHLATEPGVLELCRSALGHFEAVGCRVEEALPAYDMTALWRTWLTLRGFLVAGVLAPHYADDRRRAQLKPEAIWEIENGRVLSGADVHAASVARGAWYAAVHEMFETFDFLVLPTAQLFPFDAELPWPRAIGDRPMDTYHRWMEVTIPGTLAGLPVAAVPAGFSPAGLPMGLQILGPAQADLAVLQIAPAYELASGFSAVRPPLLG
jgi:amidase